MEVSMRIGIDLRPAQAPKQKYRGIGAYVTNLINALAKIDRTNQYFLYTSKIRPKEINPEVGNFHLDGSYSWNFLLRNRFIEWQVCLPIDLQLKKLDLFHFTFSQDVPLIYPRPVVVTVHDLISIIFRQDYRHNKLRPLFDWLWTKALARVDKIIAVSKNTKKDLIELLNIPQEKIRVIYQGVDPAYQPVDAPEAIKAVKENLGITRQYILYVGGMEPRKNLAGLFKAWRMLSDEIQRDYHLVIAGQPDQFYPEILKLVDGFNLTDKVILTGFVSKEVLVLLYNGASAFVLPSLYEGFGLPLLEAMACRCPIVSSNIASISEVAGKAAILVNPKEVKHLAKALEEILVDQDLRERLRKEGLEQVKKFSWEKTAKETLEVYQEVVDAGRD